MSYINKKNSKNPLEKGAHLNYMAGFSYDVSNPIQRLRMVASSCFFGEPQYYRVDKEDKRPVRSDAKVHRLNEEQLDDLRAQLQALDKREWRDLTPAMCIEKAIDDALEFNPEATLIEAVRLRNEEYIRTTPQVILVRAANHKKVKGTPLIGTYAKQITKRGDEPSIQLAYQLAEFGKPIPNSLKRFWKSYFESIDIYSLAKYKMANRTIKTIDVINLCHPKSEIVDKLCRDELKLTSKDTWEALISKEQSSTETWTKAVDLMGHMALLRNLRNLIINKVDSSKWLEKLKAGVKKGKQLPFRYYSAYSVIQSIATPQVLDALEDCLIKSFANAPHFPGKVMSLCDNSGSARHATTSSMGTMQISTIANLTAIFTGYLADEGYVGVFGDKLEVRPVRKRSSVFDQLKEIDKVGEGIGQATEHGIWLFWEKAIREKEHWDYVFIYSDMQAGYSQLYGNPNEYKEFLASRTYIDIPKLINKYRSTVNPDVKVFCIQVAGYEDTIMPEFYKNTYILGGWGSGIFRFAAEVSGLKSNIQKEEDSEEEASQPSQ